VYALAGTVCWALLGTALGTLPLQLAGLIVVVLYGAYFGTVEALGGRGVPPPGSRWQVPQGFVRNASRRRKLVLWGGILGPGFLTLATLTPASGCWPRWPRWPGAPGLASSWRRR
jgi:hypothetical protein